MGQTKMWQVFKKVHACSGGAVGRTPDVAIAAPTLVEARGIAYKALGEALHSIEEYVHE